MKLWAKWWIATWRADYYWLRWKIAEAKVHVLEFIIKKLEK